MNKPELKVRNTPILFFLGSGSKLKLSAFKEALDESGMHGVVHPISDAESDVAEQPVGEDEILRGAINRVLSAREIDPIGEVYISIENGIELINNEWFDYAIVLAFVPFYGNLTYVKSEAVFFPGDQVDKTYNKEGSFQLNTVGKTLKEAGIVEFHDDPHLSLVGKSRKDIVKDSLKELFNYLPKGLFLKDLNSSE